MNYNLLLLQQESHLVWWNEDDNKWDPRMVANATGVKHMSVLTTEEEHFVCNFTMDNRIVVSTHLPIPEPAKTGNRQGERSPILYKVEFYIKLCLTVI